MLCFAAPERTAGCGEVTHVWLEPGSKSSASVLTPLCTMHAETAQARGHRVRLLRRHRLAQAKAQYAGRR